MLTAEQTAAAEAHIASITPQDVERYSRYMQNVVAPKSREDEFRRFLFSFASVHTTFLSNVRLYQSLKELDWLHDAEKLKARIKRRKGEKKAGRSAGAKPAKKPRSAPAPAKE